MTVNRFDPTLYDHEYANRNAKVGDVDWYVAQCQDADRLLVLGAGTGRIAVPLAASHDVTAVDYDPEALDVLMDRAAMAEVTHRVRVVQTDLLQEHWSEAILWRFPDVVLVPFNVLNCAGLGLLHDLDEGMFPTSRLLFDFAIPTPGLWVRSREEDVRGEGRIVVNGAPWITWEYGYLDMLTMVRHTTFVYQKPDGTRTYLEVALRLFTVPEVLETLDRAGFEVEEVAGGFRGEPLDEHAVRCVVSARRT